MNNKKINELPKNIYDRLEYIEFMLRFRGWISRIDLTERFGIGEAAATRDIRQYRELAESNLELNQSTKKYEIVNRSFDPLFDLQISSAISKLRTSKISDALGMSEFDGIMCPPRISLPKVDFLSTITRAISSNRPLRMVYRSIKNGRSEKSIRAHAIFDNGVHWYLRAFDVLKKEYRTYALTRIVELDIDDNLEIDISTGGVNNDHQWNRMVSLELVPHPNTTNVKNPKTVEHDFNMEEGSLNINVRAVVAGYWLYHWSVDCTEDHSLQGYDYQLWLKNHPTLYDVESRNIAPGLSDYPYKKTSS